MRQTIESLERRWHFASAPMFVQGVTFRQVITDGLVDGAFEEGTNDTYFRDESRYFNISVTDNLGDDSGGTYTWTRQRDGTGRMDFFDDEGIEGHTIFTFDRPASGTFRLWAIRNGKDVPVYDGTFTIHASEEFAEVVDGVLTVSGSDVSEAFDLSCNTKNVFVTRNGFTKTFPRSGLASGSAIVIDAGNSDDYIDATRLTCTSIYASGGAGNDTIFGSTRDDVIKGNSGSNRLVGNDGNDNLRGSNSRDFLYGGSGEDRLYGIDGDDVLDGGGGRNRLYGGAGNDLLIGGSSNDRLYGDGGNDTLLGKRGNDVLNGGDGVDTHDDVDDDQLIGMP